MKLGQFDLKAWTYKGVPMAPVRTIARRAVAWPLFHFLRCVLFLVVWLGWGFDEALASWELLR